MVKRGNEIAVQVINRGGEYFVNIAINRMPHASLGPYKDEINELESLNLAATYLRMGRLGEK